MREICLHRIYYPVTALGPGRRLGVWVQGCGRRCEGCLSPEMQPYTGIPMPVEQILQKLPTDMNPDGLTVSGGEPFDQPGAVLEIARWFVKKYTTDVLVYTGYTLQQLRQREDPDTEALLNYTAALVDGPYRQNQNRGRGWMGSDNQNLHVFRCAERYRDFEKAQRKLQAVQEHGRLLFIGLPPQP